MSDDIVTRLRRHTTWLGVEPHTDDIAIEAADEIERLRADLNAALDRVAQSSVEIATLRQRMENPK